LPDLRQYLHNARYLAWAASRSIRPDRSCPACGGDAALLTRKAAVTALMECRRCALRFRVPKDDVGSAASFYEHRYDEGFTTTLPSAAELHDLLSTRFAGHEKDYSRYVAVLEACGVRAPATVLDFGASWGYGSWQLRSAGYEVFAYELGRTRARYATERLGLVMIDDASQPPRAVDCFFSAHVMEHLADPNVVWRAARSALRRGGVFIAFVPNGNPDLEHAERARYHRLWGNVHPLLITPRHLLAMAQRYGFGARVYSSPYPLARMSARAHGIDLLGAELAVVARAADDE
jgi:SAM-dependent methyltransferase